MNFLKTQAIHVSEYLNFLSVVRPKSFYNIKKESEFSVFTLYARKIACDAGTNGPNHFSL